MNKSSIEDYLRENGTLTYRNMGSSMLPLLKEGRDLFTLQSKTDTRCRKYDVALYRRDAHTYVLHRIVEVREDDYVFQGDNCAGREYGIRDEDILGVMTGFVRNGKSFTVNDPIYRLYSRLWPALAPVRVTLKKIRKQLSNGHKTG